MPDSPAPAPVTPPPPTQASAAANPRNIWMRGLWMVVMAMAFQLTSTLLCLLALVQFVLVLLSEKPNDRLCTFARSMGLYLHQIAEFVGFAREEVPFPFSDWPTTSQ